MRTIPRKFVSMLPSLLFLSLSFATTTTTTSALPEQVFWDNTDWPSDLTPIAGSSDGLLEGTVLFAQSQVIPSKHGIENDNQPHLTALRKTLVMFRPHKIDDESVDMEFTVRDKDGTILSGGNPIAMNKPEDITKQEGWIELGDVDANDIEFPTSLNTPYVVQGQQNLNQIGNDPKAVGLTNILNDNDKTPSNEIEIKTADGSWVRNFYFPEGSTVPTNSKIQITCNSSYNVNVHYPNAQTGGWRTRSLSKGQVLIVVLTPNNNVWLASDDLKHNDYIFGHRFYTATLNAEWVEPGMTLEFAATSGEEGVLDDIDIGGVTELVISTLDAGFLTEPRNEFTFRDDPTTNTEYFETTTASRLVVVQYETMHFTEIMLPTGKFYDTVSDDEGGVYSGDMRGFVGKLLLSHGIDLANYGVSSSLAQSESPHPYTCAFLAAHNTVGLYQNGRQEHGLSGGNGMITLSNSIGNEMSHEIGHNYGLGHYVDGFDGSVHRPSDEINSSWGWDSKRNLFIPNFSPSDTGEDQCLDDQCQSPFMGKYQFGKDSMAGGSPLWGSNRFTMYTPNSSKIIQAFLEKKAIWDPTSSTGFRKYDAASREMKEFVNPNTDNDVRLFRVPVTTIVGYYDPDPDRSLESYVYPAMHGAYGFVYNDDGGSTTGTPDGCELVVKTNKITVVYNLGTSIDSKGMNKFHVNVATEDEPYEALIYCQNELRANRALDGPKDDEPPLRYTLNGLSFDGNNDDDEDDSPSGSPSDVPSSSPSSDPSSEPSASPSDSPSETPSESPSGGPSTVAPTTIAPTPTIDAPPTVAPTDLPLPTDSPTAAPTKSPTALPTSSPTSTATPAPTPVPIPKCKDRKLKYIIKKKGKKKKKNCKWAKKKKSRCNIEWKNELIRDWCPVSCKVCPK